MKFDLSKYSTVAERLALFHKDYPDGRIITELINDYSDEKPRTWIFKSTIYLTAGDHAAGIPKATGYASEIDGTGGANNGSACENAESSSIGRSLMVCGYSVSKDGKTLASAEEMDKMNRIAETDWLAEAGKITDKAELRALYIKAKSQGAPAEVLERLKDIASQLDDRETEGTSGGLQQGKERW